MHTAWRRRIGWQDVHAGAARKCTNAQRIGLVHWHLQHLFLHHLQLLYVGIRISFYLRKVTYSSHGRLTL